jgi:hypothetical protein
MKRFATLIVALATIFTGFASQAYARFDSPQILAQNPPRENNIPKRPSQQPEQNIPKETPKEISTTTEPVQTVVPVEEYESPKEKGEVNTDLFFITEISIQPHTDLTATTSEKIVFKGYAAPNSEVTLFIYSTPIIVTVTTNAEGIWTYELDKELEDGRHTLYVARVDNAGKIVAKTNPIFFTKAEAQIEVEPSESVLISSPRKNIIDSYFILTVSIIFVFALIVTITIMGLTFRRPV